MPHSHVQLTFELVFHKHAPLVLLTKLILKAEHIMSKLRLVSVFLGLRRLVCDSLVQVSLGCVHLAEGCRRVRRLLRNLPLAVVLLLIPVQLDEVPERDVEESVWQPRDLGLDRPPEDGGSRPLF